MNDALGRPSSAVVLGGTSDIARAILEVLVRQGCTTVVLAGHDRERLAATASALRAIGASTAPTVAFDARQPGEAGAVVGQCLEACDGDVDLVLMAVGSLGEQSRDELEPDRVAEEMTVNLTWPAAALAAVAGRLREQGHGRIVVLSSVAGGRVRRANYIYGSGKAGLDAYAIGLSEALRGSGVRVQVVRPGFVRTRMTEGRAPAPLAVDASAVAAAVLRGLETNRPVVWVPAALGPLFLVLRHLPQGLWRKLPG